MFYNNILDRELASKSIDELQNLLRDKTDELSQFDVFDKEYGKLWKVLGMIENWIKVKKSNEEYIQLKQEKRDKELDYDFSNSVDEFERMEEDPYLTEFQER